MDAWIRMMKASPAVHYRCFYVLRLLHANDGGLVPCDPECRGDMYHTELSTTKESDNAFTVLIRVDASYLVLPPNVGEGGLRLPHQQFSLRQR